MFIRATRYVYVVLLWLYLAAILFQIFLAGLGFFGTGGFGSHRDLGWTLHLGPLLLLIVAGLGQVGWRLIGWNGLLLLLVGVQPFLPGARGSAPYIAALHPVNAVFIVLVNLELAKRATALVRLPTAPPAAKPTAIKPA